jgi:hypothetical protein
MTAFFWDVMSCKRYAGMLQRKLQPSSSNQTSLLPEDGDSRLFTYYGLFNDADGISDYVAVNGRAISK